jgi:hypothetical protein
VRGLEFRAHSVSQGGDICRVEVLARYASVVHPERIHGPPTGPPVPGLDPRLRRAGTWVRLFLADGSRVRESLLVGPCFINHVSTLMLGNLPNIRRKMCAAKMFDHY